MQLKDTRPMDAENVIVGRVYLAVAGEDALHPVVRVDRIHAREDEGNGDPVVGFEALTKYAESVEYGRFSALGSVRFRELYRPAFKALSVTDPHHYAVEVAAKDAVAEIRRLADKGDDGAAAGVEETLRLAVLRAIVQGHYAPQKLAGIAVATEEINFHRSAW